MFYTVLRFPQRRNFGLIRLLAGGLVLIASVTGFARDSVDLTSSVTHMAGVSGDAYYASGADCNVDGPTIAPADISLESVLSGTSFDDGADGSPACQYGGCGGDGDGYKLFGISDTCFSDFISPMTNPLFFEDPRTLSEVRFIFVQHKLSTALGSGEVQYVAAQVRAALTDRLSFIAVKDGFILEQSNVPHDNG